jgi:hypothetical protein
MDLADDIQNKRTCCTVQYTDLIIEISLSSPGETGRRGERKRGGGGGGEKVRSGGDNEGTDGQRD